MNFILFYLFVFLVIYGLYGGMIRLSSGFWPSKGQTIFFAVVALFIAFMTSLNNGSRSGGCYRDWDGRTNQVVCE
jgi:hypothetical protein